ncbi:MFS transporter [Streptomyces sp. AV19]|uniref:MFS transporter n=1 Tax=Streptomyces sp. AV19 TaxID=2793068 RepID=UPI0018FEF41F|nr:MFS transporter [Streptomyces sp. AV19]MBH1933167.1 MFS transporter [Streptomyces sp. AV19]MDG4531884.1 MFS transporter [Streptomyces sp. AV19]
MPVDVLSPPARPALSGRARLTLLVLCAAQFVVTLDFSILNVALPALGSDLGMGRAGLQWAVTAFALPSGGLLLLFGRLADRYGRRRLFLLGLGVFTAASVLVTLAPDAASFLAGRALQGVAAALIVPTGMALLTTSFPEGPLRERALGISGTLLSLGYTTGMVLGGVMTDALGWRSTMGLLAVAGLGVLLLSSAVPAPSRVPRPARPDVPGAVTVTGGLLCLVYALSSAAQRGFGDADVVVALAAGLGLLAAFAVAESRVADPLVPLSMLRRRTVAWGNLGGLATVSTMTALIFLLTLYLQDVLGLSAFRTGLLFGVQGLFAAFAGMTASRVVARFGARRVLVGSLLFQAVATAPLVWLGTGPAAAWAALAAASAGVVGNLWAVVAYGVTATSGAPDDEQGLATALVTSAQQLGTTVGIPVVGVVVPGWGLRGAMGLDAVVVALAGLGVALGLRGGARRAE